MWSALGMYALRETWREKKKLRKMRRKHKEKQKIIIPSELFYSEETSYLPTFEKVKIQEDLPYWCDPSSPDEYSKYAAKFEYSMGGNVKMYDNHIALTSPKKKLQKPSDINRQNLDKTMDNLNDSFNSSVRDAQSLDDSRHKLEGDDLNFTSTSRLLESMDKLDISAASGRQSRKWLRTSDSLEEIDIRKRVDSRERDYSPIRNTSTRNLERQEDFSTTDSKQKSERDYSPIRNTNKMLQETSDYYKAKSTLNTKKDHHETSGNTNSGVRANESAPGMTGQGGDINVLESLSRYDLTLNYVNQQNKTLQNGDYNELDIALSDLSSDVFTDSELHFTMPDTANEWTKRRPDKDFYPDSPVSECAFFKTPCSSRKNSYDSLISDESLTDTETDVRGNILAPIRRSLVQSNGHNGHHAHMNGLTNGDVKTAPKGKGPHMQNGRIKTQNGPRKFNDVKNAKTKAGSNYKPGVNKGKINSKKVDYSKTASKVDSFRNISHVPGGGSKKVNNGRINHYKHVEPRTDTHGVEAYSHLPPEFQEIARRLSRQDKDLRDMTGSRGRPRSRLTSRSSRGGSISPRDRSPGRSGNLAKQYGTNMSASSLSLTSTASAKKRRTLHPRPVTPSLSRSHPATSCTLYDSRSRPSSRQASRSSSPVRSRNSSPSRGRNGSVSSNRMPRSASPHREGSRKLSASGGSGYETPRGERSKSRNRTGSRSRLDDNRPSTPVMDILSYNTSRSLFQVVPVHR